MGYSFNCYGHENITAKHKTTMEFTKDKELSLKGDCVVGVKCDFSLKDLREFIKNKVNAIKENNNKEKSSIRLNRKIKDNGGINKKVPIKITIKTNNLKEEVNGFLNPYFKDKKEIVIRKSGFVSERTLAFGADKASNDIERNMVNLMKNYDTKMEVKLT